MSVAAGKIIIPATANRASGKTSVCIGAETRVANRSRCEPIRAAAWATKEPPGSDTLSAINSSDGRASTSSTPHIT